MKPNSTRVFWVDNLRTMTILLVVNMHACVTYSHVGSWYFMVAPEPPIISKIPFFFWQGHLQAFFMGLLFFIAGYFADRSLVRKVPKAFFAERLVRLGVPTLIYMLALHPLIVFGLLSKPTERPSFKWYLTEYIGHGRFVGSSGPMWFAFALLILSIPFGYFFKSGSGPSSTNPIKLRASVVLALGIALGVGSFLVRLVQPIGTNILNFQLCFFTQYLVAFALGVFVSRRDSLHQIASSKVAWRAGWAALVLGPVVLLVTLAVSQKDLSKNPPPFYGGWNWQALVMALWEQCSGVGLALGAMAICVRFLGKESRFLTWLSDRAFGVYLLHAPILVGITLLIIPIHANILLMAILLTILSWVASFFATDLVHRVPIIRAIL